MRFTGKLLSVNRDWRTGEYSIVFSVNEKSALSEIEKVQNLEKLSIEAKQYRAKRSLDANAYAWQLMSKIADATHRTKEEVYVDALKNYGQHAFLFRVEHNTEVALDGVYVKYLEFDGIHDIYEAFRGSSTYDTKEMSDFIEGIVQDAKELGIDTVPRVELEKIKEKWHL